MKHMDLHESTQKTIQWLNAEMQQRISMEKNLDRRHLLDALTIRQQNSLGFLKLIHTRRADMEEAQKNAREPEAWLKVLLHPAGGLVMPVLIVTAALLGWKVATIILSILALVRAVLVLVFPAKPAKETVCEVYEPYVNEEELDDFLRNQRDGILADAGSILQQFAVAASKSETQAESDLISLLCALSEAAADHPDCDDLGYPLSILETRFYRMGLELVHYSPEDEDLFEIITANYREHERWPAIRSRENGLLIHKGQYLKKH